MGRPEEKTKGVADQIAAIVSGKDKRRERPNVVSMSLMPSSSDAPKIKYVELPIDDITPRAVNKYSQTRIENLVNSIRRTGNRLIHPIVVCKGKDLDPEGEVYKKFVAAGVDPKKLPYVIVSGERRYRAWLKLREEEEKKRDTEPFFSNPFDTITANVLTAKEARSEEVFFEDANLEARQLTPLEALLHVKDALEVVKTEDAKKEALKTMGKDPTKERFNQADYCRYYLEEELGIETRSIDSIKHDLHILKNCDDEVIEALINKKINYRPVSKIAALDKKRQKELLDIYINNGATAFNKELGTTGKTKSKEKKELYREAHTRVAAMQRNVGKEIKALERIAGKLDDKFKGPVEALIQLLQKQISELEQYQKIIKE